MRTDLDALLTACGRGEHTAFAALYDATIRSVLATTTRVLRDRSLAEDAAQEAYVEIWRHAARFDPARGGALPWVNAIARRRAIDRVRHEQAQTDRLHSAGPTTLEIDHDVVDEHVQTAHEHATIRRAMRSLSALQREAITLVYFQDLTSTEAAERLHVPVATLKTRLRDAVQRLRQTVSENPGTAPTPSGT